MYNHHHDKINITVIHNKKGEYYGMGLMQERS